MKKQIVASLLVFFSTLFIGGVPCISGELIYNYDELNRLERVEKPEKYIIEYFYDSVGNRTSKTILVTSPDFDSDNDSDIDGVDLYSFLINWDQDPQSLSNFANAFGKIE